MRYPHAHAVVMLAVGAMLPVPATAAPGCFETLAATRNYTLGAPRQAEPTPDGRSVLFLRSGPRDTGLRLFRFDLVAGSARTAAKA